MGNWDCFAYVGVSFGKKGLIYSPKNNLSYRTVLFQRALKGFSARLSKKVLFRGFCEFGRAFTEKRERKGLHFFTPDVDVP